MCWVDSVLVPAYGFNVDDLLELHPLAVITNGEAQEVVTAIVKSLDISEANITRCLIDIVQPDADIVMERNVPIEIELQMENDVCARTCQWCGSMFLRTEKNDGSLCCRKGLMLQFTLNPLPEELNAVIDIRNAGPARLARLCRPLNSYFAFSRLRTSGFFASGVNSVDLNVGQDQAMMRICGRAYNVVMQNISTTMNAYVFDGTSDHLMAQLRNEMDLVVFFRDLLVRKNPLGAMFRLWDSMDFKEYSLTIKGVDSGKPAEVACVLHRPDAYRDSRAFDVTLAASQKYNTSKDKLLTVSYLDCRADAFHYPLLHWYGEMGWGSATRQLSDGNSCTLMDYYRFRFLSADRIELAPSSDVDESGRRYFTMVNDGIVDEHGIPHVCEAVRDVPGESVFWQVSNSASNRATITTSRFHVLSSVAQEYLVEGFTRMVDDRAQYVRQKRTRHSTGSDDTRYLPKSFFGGSTFMKEKKENALTVVKNLGNPLLFITLTTNAEWDEFKRVLMPGQTAYDSPVWTARIFTAKLSAFIARLRNGSLFYNCRRGRKFAFSLRGGPGLQGYDIHVVEFQKRGMPHAHICFRPWNGSEYEARMERGDFGFVDEIVTAECPDSVDFLRRWGMVLENDEIHGELLKLSGSDRWGQNATELLYEIQRRVQDHMTHRQPCRSYCFKERCPGKCRFGFPFAERVSTGLDERTGILLLRRRESDQFVVPYNPWILMMFNAHCNVQVCCSKACIGYLYKYVFKGVDRASMGFQRVDKDTGEVEKSDKLQDYLDGRYVSAAEAAWRVMAYPMYEMTHTVDVIECHLPGETKKVRQCHVCVTLDVTL